MQLRGAALLGEGQHVASKRRCIAAKSNAKISLKETTGKWTTWPNTSAAISSTKFIFRKIPFRNAWRWNEATCCATQASARVDGSPNKCKTLIGHNMKLNKKAHQQAMGHWLGGLGLGFSFSLSVSISLNTMHLWLHQKEGIEINIHQLAKGSLVEETQRRQFNLNWDPDPTECQSQKPVGHFFNQVHLSHLGHGANNLRPIPFREKKGKIEPGQLFRDRIDLFVCLFVCFFWLGLGFVINIILSIGSINHAESWIMNE